MNEFSKEILACIQGAGVNDFDQRSAIGMARTWVEKRKPVKRADYGPFGGGPSKRDDLAEALIAKFEANPLKEEEYIEILAEVREVINRPYFDPRSNGAKTGKAILKPRDKKKAKGE